MNHEDSEPRRELGVAVILHEVWPRDFLSTLLCDHPHTSRLKADTRRQQAQAVHDLPREWPSMDLHSRGSDPGPRAPARRPYGLPEKQQLGLDLQAWQPRVQIPESLGHFPGAPPSVCSAGEGRVPAGVKLRVPIACSEQGLGIGSCRLCQLPELPGHCGYSFPTKALGGGSGGVGGGTGGCWPPSLSPMWGRAPAQPRPSLPPQCPAFIQDL